MANKNNGNEDRANKPEKKQQTQGMPQAEPEKAQEAQQAKEQQAPDKKKMEEKKGAPAENEKDRKLAELTESLKRLQAEFENYKKRVEREKAEVAKYAAGDLIEELLTILDDFERVPVAEINSEKVRKGVEMIHSNLKKVLESEGLRPIVAEGQLDPHKHEALMWVEREDLPENTIVAVLQKGYSLNGTILRPARVSVSKRPEMKESK